jgi:hypothetical protein
MPASGASPSNPALPATATAPTKQNWSAPDKTGDVKQATYPNIPEVKGPPNVAPVASPAPPASVAPVPLSSVPPAPFPALVACDLRPEPDGPLVCALRCFADNRPNDAVAWLERFEKPNQEILMRLLPLVVQLADCRLAQASPAQMSAAVAQLEAIQEPLRLKAEPALDKMCFCRRIDRFGVYDALPDMPEFHPGEQVQVYVELKNFGSEYRDGKYVTALASTAEILDLNKKVVWFQAFPDRDRPDVSLTQRHDYFKNYRFCLPNKIESGEYILRLQVKDLTTQRSVHPRTLDFRIGTKELSR